MLIKVSVQRRLVRFRNERVVLLQAPVGAWSGPYRSGYGWHLVRVSHRQAAQVPDFDEVRERVRDDFVAAERQARANEVLGTLRRKYVIHVAAQP